MVCTMSNGNFCVHVLEYNVCTYPELDEEKRLLGSLVEELTEGAATTGKLVVDLLQVYPLWGKSTNQSA